MLNNKALNKKQRLYKFYKKAILRGWFDEDYPAEEGRRMRNECVGVDKSI